jgi:hypothetical protein
VPLRADTLFAENGNSLPYIGVMTTEHRVRRLGELISEMLEKGMVRRFLRTRWMAK